MAKSLKQKILEEHGLVEYQEPRGQRKHKRLATIPPSNFDHLKTPHMKYLELKHRKPIEQLLLEGSLSTVAKNLGIDTSTASRWIAKLKLRYTEDNLPQCEGCTRFRRACELGICAILSDMELWDLVLVKQKELIGGEQ